MINSNYVIHLVRSIQIFQLYTITMQSSQRLYHRRVSFYSFIWTVFCLVVRDNERMRRFELMRKFHFHHRASTRVGLEMLGPGDGDHPFSEWSSPSQIFPAKGQFYPISKIWYISLYILCSNYCGYLIFVSV